MLLAFPFKLLSVDMAMAHDIVQILLLIAQSHAVYTFVVTLLMCTCTKGFILKLHYLFVCTTRELKIL